MANAEEPEVKEVFSKQLTQQGQSQVCDVINCIAFYYERGKCGNSFLRKEKFPAQLSQSIRTVKAVKEAVRSVTSLVKL